MKKGLFKPATPEQIRQRGPVPNDGISFMGVEFPVMHGLFRDVPPPKVTWWKKLKHKFGIHSFDMTCMGFRYCFVCSMSELFAGITPVKPYKTERYGNSVFHLVCYEETPEEKKRSDAMHAACVIMHSFRKYDEVVEIPCPLCGGELAMTMSSYNGHIHGKCETAGCLSWMQ